MIRKAGGTAIFSRTDTTDSDSVRAAMADANAAHGDVEVLVNNAAAFVFGKVEDVTQADWAKVFGVNVIGYANCVREVLPSMRRQNGGAIVNIASVSSFIAQPEFIPYNASKGAVAQLTRCLAMDLSSDNKNQGHLEIHESGNLGSLESEKVKKYKFSQRRSIISKMVAGS